MKWGHGVPLLVIYNLPLKFGLKQSTLKIWVFRALGSRFHLSPLELEMSLENNSPIFWKIFRLNWNPSEDMNKTQKSFRNRRRLIFPPNLLENWFLQKSRQSWVDTVILSCDKIHKMYQNLKFWSETLTIPYPCESTMLTNWRHWKRINTPPRIHLPVERPSLAQLRLTVG